jgi:uncharacterized membrane protein
MYIGKDAEHKFWMPVGVAALACAAALIYRKFRARYVCCNWLVGWLAGCCAHANLCHGMEMIMEMVLVVMVTELVQIAQQSEWESEKNRRMTIPIEAQYAVGQ